MKSESSNIASECLVGTKEKEKEKEKRRVVVKRGMKKNEIERGTDHLLYLFCGLHALLIVTVFSHVP